MKYCTLLAYCLTWLGWEVSQQNTPLFSPYVQSEERPLYQAERLHYNAVQETVPGRSLHMYERYVVNHEAGEPCDVS